jgi:hypothetical protein
MAVTAHWIERVSVDNGAQNKLQLRSDLIGFHNIPGRHTGAHLARCFLYLSKRIGLPNEKVSRNYDKL